MARSQNNLAEHRIIKKPVYRPSEIGSLCGVSHDMVQTWADHHGLVCHRLQGRERRVKWRDLVVFLLSRGMFTEAKQIGWDRSVLLVGCNAELAQTARNALYQTYESMSFLEAGSILEQQLPSVVIIDFANSRRDALIAGEVIRHRYTHAKRVALVYDDEASYTPNANDVYDVVIAQPAEAAVIWATACQT